MKEHNKILGVWISVSCFGSTFLKLFCRPRCTGQPVKKLQGNWNLISFYPLGGVFDGCLLRPSVLGKGSRLNYIISVPLPWKFFEVSHSTDIYGTFSCITSTARWVFKHYFFLVSLSHDKRWDFQLFQYFWKSTEYLCFFFIIHIYTHTHTFIRNLYSTMYLITIEI